jgi:hypothetical protein
MRLLGNKEAPLLRSVGHLLETAQLAIGAGPIADVLDVP